MSDPPFIKFILNFIIVLVAIEMWMEIVEMGYGGILFQGIFIILITGSIMIINRPLEKKFEKMEKEE